MTTWNVPPEALERWEASQAVRNRAFATGLRLSRLPDGTYRLGPKEIMKQHPELVAELSQHKEVIKTMLDTLLTVGLVGCEHNGTQPLPPAYEQVICLHCAQTIYLYHDTLDNPGVPLLTEHTTGHPKARLCPGSKRPGRQAPVGAGEPLLFG